MRCINKGEECAYEYVKDWMRMVSDEMKSTNFVNSVGFVSHQEFDWDDMMDKEMQDWIMYWSGDNNDDAYLFVEHLRNMTLKFMEDEGEESLENSDDGIELEEMNVMLDDGDRIKEEKRQRDAAKTSQQQEEDGENHEAPNESACKTQETTATAEARDAGTEAEETPGLALS